MTMLRTLRAFAWMRWRVLMNTLERTGPRDTLERLSLAVEQIGPLIAFGLMAPSAVGLAGLGGYAGYALPGDSRVVTFDVIRILLGVATAFCVLGPILMPSMERTNAVRLLLLPIPRPTLYVAQAAGAFSDPWVLLALALVLALPVGLAIAGAVTAAGIALAAALLFMTVLIGLSAAAAFVLHLLVRDRRRGELLTLLFIVVLPLIGLLPTLLGPSGSRVERRAQRIARAERQARGEETRLERATRLASQTYTLLPSELALHATRASANGNATAALAPLAGLAFTGLALHGAAFAAFVRLLGSPGTGSRRPSVADTSSRRAWLPGLSRAEAAVALAQLRLALRTPRGRSIIVSPLIVFGMLAILALRQRQTDFGPLAFNSGLGLATFGSAVSLLSILPFAMNQFAIDRAGLTLALLSPLAHRELLVGKAVGNAMIVSLPASFCIVIALLVFRDGSPALWLSIIPALVATYAAAAPVAAALSAMLPRKVDLNSIGRGSNAHGLAGFLGLLAMVAAGTPPALIVIVAVGFLRSPSLATLLLFGWCVVSLIAGRILLGWAGAVFDRRRENLNLTAR